MTYIPEIAPEVLGDSSVAGYERGVCSAPYQELPRRSEAHEVPYRDPSGRGTLIHSYRDLIGRITGYREG